MTRLTKIEIAGLVDRLGQRPEVRVAILEERIRKALEILSAPIPQPKLALAIIDAVDALGGEMSNQEIDYEAMDVEQLRERVSLLEMKLSFERDWRKGQEELAKRIDKAKAILAESVKRECGTFETRYYYDEIKLALEALEGK